MKEITTHRAAGDELHGRIEIHATDQQAEHNGAHHDYLIEIPQTKEQGGSKNGFTVAFHNERAPAHLGENAMTGYTVESLLAICMHRLADLQAGPTQHDQYKAALAYLDGALTALHTKTLAERQAVDVN